MWLRRQPGHILHFKLSNALCSSNLNLPARKVYEHSSFHLFDVEDFVAKINKNPATLNLIQTNSNASSSVFYPFNPMYTHDKP